MGGVAGLKFFRPDQFQDLIATLNQSFLQDYGYVLLLDRPLSEKHARIINLHSEILCFATGPYWSGNDWPAYVQGFISDPSDKQQIEWALEQARRAIELRHERDQLRIKIAATAEKFDQILSAALDLVNERDPEKLCNRILAVARKLTAAEGASLYLYNAEQNHLLFSHVQNEKFDSDFKPFRLPLNETSMAGACAYRRAVIHVEDVYEIPEHETFRFNKHMDERTGYRTKSILCFPIVKRQGELIGVIQLINSKRYSSFTAEDIDVGQALSNYIAVALENALLYQDIEALFEGFVMASVTAIESRDPTTSGHSERVALATLKLAEFASESQEKTFRHYELSDEAARQLRYAALLHDFGKIGVPETVLLKAKKLFPEELREIEWRMRALKVAYPDRAGEFERAWQIVQRANEPTVLPEKALEELDALLNRVYLIGDDDFQLLTKSEFEKLSIAKGSLTNEDREAIESHVTHSFKFLEQIPWTRDLHRVPEIAFGHHERPDGSGYPQKLKGDQIPFESQIMAVADIFDALVAKDRPYKRAIPVEKALTILQDEAKANKLNKDLVELFVAKKAYLF